MKSVSVIVPVYYNEESLNELYGEIASVENQLKDLGLSLDLIFVDDGSGDHSLNELLKIKHQRPETKVIKLTRNFGSYHAIKTAYSFVEGDCFVSLAADLQDPPDLILKMVKRWCQGSKYVVAARSDRHDPLLSTTFAKIYYFLLRLFVIKDYPRQGYDLALMDKSLMPYLLNSSKNINLSLFAFWLGFQPDVIYYSRKKRPFGKSRWTVAKKVKLFLDSLLGFSILPIRLISALGLFVSIISFLYGLFVVINALLGRMDVRGFATVVALIAFLLGLIIIMLGVIGEYIWRIFDEVNKRPETVIDDVF